MSNTPWTPGPWKYWPNDSVIEFTGPNGGDWGGFKFVHQGCNRLKDDAIVSDCDEVAATGLLISKAPDMADVLLQWRDGEKSGDEQEIENAKVARDRLIERLLKNG